MGEVVACRNLNDRVGKKGVWDGPTIVQYTHMRLVHVSTQAYNGVFITQIKAIYEFML